MTAEELVLAVESAGGSFSIENEQVSATLPPEIPDTMVDDLRAVKLEVKRILLERRQAEAGIPPLPRGVRLLAWEPKEPPILLTRSSVVVDVNQFIRTAIRQLGHALADNNPWLAGNWSVRDLMEQLEQAGVKLEVFE